MTEAAAAAAAPDGLPPLREVIRRYGLAAKKSLGQNFLFDLNLAARIAGAAGPLEGVTVFEVGPGPGGLTRALLKLGAARVLAVERDGRAIAALEEIASHYPGRLDIVMADALTFDPRPHLPDGPVRIVANLPYNIATALLVSWLETEPWPPWYECAILMFQREVAQRIVAHPRSKSYGRLSVLAQWRCAAQILFDINAAAFVPPPNVKSSLVRLVPRAAPMPCDRELLASAAQAAFGQRRKMLRQSLRSLGVDVADLLAAARLDATLRAEDLAVADFVALARALAACRANRHDNDGPSGQGGGDRR